MMTPEQLQAAYMAGRSHVSMDASIDYEMRKHLAGLAEVARQQVERDAREVALIRNGYNRAGATYRILTKVETAIRAQFVTEATRA